MLGHDPTCLSRIEQGAANVWKDVQRVLVTNPFHKHRISLPSEVSTFDIAVRDVLEFFNLSARMVSNLPGVPRLLL